MTLRTKQILFPVLILVVGIVAFQVMMATRSSAEKKEEEKRVPYVSVQRVEMAPLQLHAESQGLVKPRYSTRLVSEVSGKVVKVSPAFVNGGLVKEGELLAQIDPFDYEVRLEQAKANLASARAAFVQERAQGRVAEAEWAQITDAEPSELGLRKPQQEQALAAVKASEAALKQAEKDLQRTEIRAPFDALIAGRQISPGTYVNVGAQLGELLDVSLAEVRLPVSQDDFAVLNQTGEGAQVVLSATTYGEQNSWQATISRDEGMVDDSSRMVYLVAEIADPYGLNTDKPRLPFGTYVTADIAGKELANATRVPRRLLRDGELGVIQDGKLTFVPVEVVRHEGKYSVISTGLNNGDLLVTSALDTPIEGMDLTWQDAGTVAANSSGQGE